MPLRATSTVCAMAFLVEARRSQSVPEPMGNLEHRFQDCEKANNELVTTGIHTNQGHLHAQGGSA